MLRIRNWILIIVSLFVWIYLIGVVLFHGRFLPGTTVNGQSIMFLSPAEVTSQMESETGRHHMTFVLSDGTRRQISFQELGIQSKNDKLLLYEDTGSSWLWPISWIHPKQYDVKDELLFVRTDMKEKLDHVEWLSGGQTLQSDSVRVVVDGDSFRLIGTGGDSYIDTNRLADVISESLLSGNLTIDLTDSDCYRTVEDVVPMEPVKLGSMSKDTVVSMKLDLKFNDEIHEVIPSSILEQSVYEQSGFLYVRPHILLSYLYVLGDKYDTVGSMRTFHTSSGDTLSLTFGENDTYRGFDLDESGLLVSILSSLEHQDTSVIDVPWTNVGKDLLGVDNDFGDTYIEIDLASQHLWYYENGTMMLDSDVVTGLPTEERQTPTGLFYVRGAYRDYMMYYRDGAAKADYFLSVTPSGVGIHDTYRQDYGGSIYTYAGSHGCINLPYAVAKDLFHRVSSLDNFEIPVIIYDTKKAT